MTTYYSYVESPLCQIAVQGDGQFITGLHMLPSHRHWPGIDADWQEDAEPFHAIRQQLNEYFAGERQEFDLPLKLAGTPFQQRVWQELVRIPFGKTITYAQLAQRVGKPTAFRAVGSANGRNPISIIVPCHRVIGADGTLTGYGGGVERKQWLLDWEHGAAGSSSGGYLFDVAETDSEDSTVSRSPSIAARSGKS
jgi:methylated-DNA-[protein]-cysteine S-methyltransferase